MMWSVVHGISHHKCGLRELTPSNFIAEVVFSGKWRCDVTGVAVPAAIPDVKL